MTTLGAGDDGQALGPGDLAGRDDGTGSDRIDGHGLFDEAMLAGLDGGGEVQRPEGGRRRHHDVVAAAGDDLAVGVKAVEAALRRKLEPVADGIGLGLEGVADGGDLGLEVQDLAGLKEVGDGAVATPAAADETDLDARAVAGGVGVAGGQGGAGQGGVADEVTTWGLHGG